MDKPINSEKTPKQVRTVLRSAGGHWVGDGFPVRTLFFYSELGRELSPFLMLDYAGPREFPPTQQRLGVGEHPHRGFETVTIVYHGEVEHRDSSGGGGRIGPGDVQWMTAASGLVHEEFHGRQFAGKGGLFEMVQLWVNLPAKDKMSPPRYQAIVNDRIPKVGLSGGGSLRVIAGEFAEARGPADTFTPINVWDLRLAAKVPVDLGVPSGHTTLLVALRGSIRINGSESIGPAEVALFEREGNELRLDSTEGATALLLSGEPINEPIAGMGPFVMNTQQEIQQAVADYQSGRMGHLS
ncbi:MAG TPA: pirin family protein [Gammaproteobacteria bacterium]|nr:pirin family protein [Gammaproteobacteria bacterium]